MASHQQKLMHVERNTGATGQKDAIVIFRYEKSCQRGAIKEREKFQNISKVNAHAKFEIYKNYTRLVRM